MSTSVLITSFGSFGDFEHNPSQRVMDVLREHHQIRKMFRVHWEVLPVSYQAVDEFMQHASPPDWAFLLGVASGSEKMRLERRGRNWADGEDVKGVDPKGGPIDMQDTHRETAIPVQELRDFREEHADILDLSQDAGTYLCNYLYYRTLGLPRTRSLFVHIADVDHVPEAPSVEHQAEVIRELIERLIRNGPFDGHRK